MKNIIIIGTIHLNTTPHEELIAEVSRHQPDQVLIELSPNEVAAGKAESIRDEMFAVLEWCKHEGVPYNVFDVELDTLKPGVTGQEPEFLAAEARVKAMLADYDWKALNDERRWAQGEVKELNDVIIQKYFDPEKMQERNRQLEENLKLGLVDGVNVVVTGSAHIPDLLRAFPEAEAPLAE